MPHPTNPIPASSAFKVMKLAFMPPFPVPCSEDAFSSLMLQVSSCPPAHTYTTFLIPQPHPYLLFQTKSFCAFHVFHTCSPISHSPLEHNPIPPTQPQTPPLHILPAEHRSSSSRATLPLLLLLPALRENSTQEQPPACQKASDTSKPLTDT